jgi:hypothetical protein
LQSEAAWFSSQAPSLTKDNAKRYGSPLKTFRTSKKVEEYLTWVDPISGFYVEAPPAER